MTVKSLAWKAMSSKKSLKTMGWAGISGMIYTTSGLIAGAELGAVLVAASLAVALKTPVYYLYELVFGIFESS